MPLLLSIDTSTKICSAALHQNGELLGLSEIFIEKSHSRIIIGLINNLLKAAGHILSELDAVAVSMGPGSYTGLRIGVSTAKGLCFSVDKPLIAINTLEAMAFTVNEFNLSGHLVCPMIDARRMEVYCAIFDKENKCLQQTQAKIIDGNSFEELLADHKILFFGDGAMKCKTILSHHKNAIFLDQIYPSAKSIGTLAHKAFEEKRFEDLAYFEPFYLKDFISK